MFNLRLGLKSISRSMTSTTIGQRIVAAAANATVKVSMAPLPKQILADCLLHYKPRDRAAISAAKRLKTSSRHRSWVMRSAALIKHSVSIAGHATSVSLEPTFWEVVRARRAAVPVGQRAVVADRCRAQRQFVERDPSSCWKAAAAASWATATPGRRRGGGRRLHGSSAPFWKRTARAGRNGSGQWHRCQSQPVPQGEAGRRAERRAAENRAAFGRGKAERRHGRRTRTIGARSRQQADRIAPHQIVLGATQPAAGPSARR